MDSVSNFISARLVFTAVILLLLLGYWVFNFVIIYHLTRFGIGTQPKRFAAVFLLGSVTLFFVGALLFANIDLNSLKSRFGRIDKNVITAPFSPQ